MLPALGDAVPFILAFAVPFAIVLALMPPLIRFLRSRGRVAIDVHKPERASVPTPAGPLLVAGLVGGEAAVFLFYRSFVPLALIGVVVVAGLIGLYDDVRGLGGVAKPVLMIGAAVPMLAVQMFYPALYDARLYFPLFANTGTHFIIFGLIIVASMPVASNAFNMIDAFNGEISGFTVIVSVALIAGALLRSFDVSGYGAVRIAAMLPLTAVSLALYFYNRYPSRVFDGDSGSLAFGATYAALAIVGGIEIAALVAVIPAILNSYYILSSVRGLVERKKMNARPTFLGEDGKLHASTEPGAPTTLARMILTGGPLTERELVGSILFLAAVSVLLSVLTSVMTWLP